MMGSKKISIGTIKTYPLYNKKIQIVNCFEKSSQKCEIYTLSLFQDHFERKGPYKYYILNFGLTKNILIKDHWTSSCTGGCRMVTRCKYLPVLNHLYILQTVHINLSKLTNSKCNLFNNID